MQPNFIFFGALLGIFILRPAKAYIPGCHFLKTANLTSSQMLSDGSYIYQGILVPVKLTGEYEYIITETGIISKVSSHVRGCVCQLKPCLWVCCRFKDMQTNGECTDGLMDELERIKPVLDVKLFNGSVVKRTLPSDFIVLRDRIRRFEDWKELKYTVYEENKYVALVSNEWTSKSFQGYDCLHPNQFSSGNTESFVAAYHTNPYSEGPLVAPPGAAERKTGS